MSAQQIKSNINDLVNRIEDEDKLKACYLVLATVANNDKKLPLTKAAKPRIAKKNIATSSRRISVTKVAVNHQKHVQSHDLSLVLLANDLFKGSESLSEIGEIAFERAFKKSLKKEPSLPNRL
jgi:hypothetical protein